jgi:hypothetical protein
MGKMDDQLLGPLEQSLGVSLASFADLPQGQSTLAVTRNGWDGMDTRKFPGIVFLLDAKDKSDELKTSLSVLQKKWAAAGKTIHKQTIHGVTFSIIPLSTNDLPSTLTGLLPGSQPTLELGRAPEPARPHELVVAQ